MFSVAALRRMMEFGRQVPQTVDQVVKSYESGFDVVRRLNESSVYVRAYVVCLCVCVCVGCVCVCVHLLVSRHEYFAEGGALWNPFRSALRDAEAYLMTHAAETSRLPDCPTCAGVPGVRVLIFDGHFIPSALVAVPQPMLVRELYAEYGTVSRENRDVPQQHGCPLLYVVTTSASCVSAHVRAYAYACAYVCVRACMRA